MLYAERPELIRARASRQTYGVRTAVPYEEGMPGGHRGHGRYICHPFCHTHTSNCLFASLYSCALVDDSKNGFTSYSCTAGKFWHPTELSYFSSLGFSPFVKRGQLVGADEEVTHVFTPLSDDQEVMRGGGPCTRLGGRIAQNSS